MASRFPKNYVNVAAGNAFKVELYGILDSVIFYSS